MADTTNEEFTGSNHLHSEKLRAFLERIMGIRAEKKYLARDEAAVFAEAKSEGFAPKYMRAVLKLMALYWIGCTSCNCTYIDFSRSERVIFPKFLL